MEASEGPAHLSISPTFSSYSSGSGSSSIAEIAARVVSEIGEESLVESEDHAWKNQVSDYRFHENFSTGDVKESAEEIRNNDHICSENGDVEDDEFEFAVLCSESDPSTSSANEIFHNGQIKTVYPVFNTKLLLGNGSRVESEKNPKTNKPCRSPLRKLMYEEKRKKSSLSSSESDDLGDVPSDSYCVWSPNTEKSSPGRSIKRNSPGSFNGWKLRDLLYNNNRSKSEGENRRSAIGVGSNSGFESFALPNARYGRNRSAAKEAEKRKSYLPYRQNLVGCAVNTNSTI